MKSRREVSPCRPRAALAGRFSFQAEEDGHSRCFVKDQKEIAREKRKLFQ